MSDSDQQTDTTHDRATGYRFLIQSMILMALIDGHVADEEIEMIDSIHEQLTEERLGTETIKAFVEDLQGQEEAFIESLRENAPKIFEPTKDLIVKGCYLVLMADGIVDDAERGLLNRLTNALGVTYDRLESLIDSLGPNGTIG